MSVTETLQVLDALNPEEFDRLVPGLLAYWTKHGLPARWPSAYAFDEKFKLFKALLAYQLDEDSRKKFTDLNPSGHLDNPRYLKLANFLFERQPKSGFGVPTWIDFTTLLFAVWWFNKHSYLLNPRQQVAVREILRWVVEELLAHLRVEVELPLVVGTKKVTS